MPQTIQCPNCKAPVEPDPQRPTIICTYCGYHMKNTVYAPPQPQPRPQAPPTPTYAQPMRRYIWLFYIVPVVLMVLGSLVSWLASRSHSVTTPPSSTGPAPYPYSEEERLAAQAKLDPNRQKELKLAPYIQCVADSYDWILENSRDRYLGWVKDREGGPTCKEEWIRHGLTSPPDSWVEACGAPLEKAAAQPPDLPDLERVGAAYGAALTGLAPLLKEASAYYEKKSYALDDCKKGREMHPRLMAGFKALVAAREALRPVLAAEAKGTLQRCLDRSQGVAGRKGTYLWARAVKLAGDAVAVMHTQWKAKRPDLEQVKRAIARYSEAVSALEAATDAERDAAGFSSAWSKGPLDELQTAAVAFLKTGAGHKLSSQSRYLIRVSKWKLSSIEGTFEKVVSHYDAIVKGTESFKDCGRLPPCELEECPEPR